MSRGTSPAQTWPQHGSIVAVSVRGTRCSNKVNLRAGTRLNLCLRFR